MVISSVCHYYLTFCPSYFILLFCLFVFETVSPVTQAGYLPKDDFEFLLPCLHLSSAGIKGISDHAWLISLFNTLI